MEDLIAKLEAATEGSRELDEAVHQAIHQKPPHLRGGGKAPMKGPYSLDLSVCDMCGAPATTVVDLSIQLPDYRGVCEEHARLAKENQSAWYAYYRIPILHYTTSLDAAMTLVPEGFLWTASNRAIEPHAGRGYVRNRELQTTGISGTIPNPNYKSAECTAATPALALCIAALKAREAAK